MDFVKRVVAQVVKQAETDEWSAACLATTNPVYLFFSGNSDAPVYVTRVTPSTQLCTHDIGVLLHRAAGDLVPEPIGLVHQDGKRFSIQKGASGMPWFHIAHKYSEPAQWQALRNTAKGALQQFHNRITINMPEDRQSIRPAEQLGLAYDRFLKINGDAPEGLSALVQVYEKALGSLGQIEGVPQHGDFCLNNLIISENPGHVTVIDFEDFNLTQMPLYDESTLALSLYNAAPNSVKSHLSHELRACMEGGAGEFPYDVRVVEGLFLYHLLTRLGHWSLGIKRRPYRQWLLSILDQFSHNPKMLFPS